ncbi:aminotransferase class III-fold pyridoxal phosphate-dependent enzyme, partial [Candidatus Binatia bacterium]|nr:aminotransferase class III-fold pyridoxal phosphate-dependent enzyme [Candidatus Binatia bacterium]
MRPTARDAAASARGDLAPSAIAPLLERLRRAREALLARDAGDVARALGRVSTIWLEDDRRRRAAADEIAQGTGYAPSMVDLSLQRTFAAWNEAAILDLLKRALAGAELELPGASAVRRPAGGRIATAPELVLAVLAQNTPGLAVAPVFTALALRAAIVVKSSRGEPSFAPLLARSIAEVDPALGESIAAHSWPGGTAAIEDPLFAAASRIVTYGSAETIAAVRARAGERVVAYGPRASVAVLAGERLADFPNGPARTLAREVAFLDQRGCLSPQLVLVDDRLDLGALGEALARELAALESEWPRRRLPLDAGTAFRRAVDTVEAEILAGTTAALHGGAHEPWAVVVERSAQLRATPLDRFVRLHPFTGADGLRTALMPLRGALECVGIEASPEIAAEIAAACRASGAARLCRLGAMQDPPAEWRSGGRTPLSGWLDWSTSEVHHDEDVGHGDDDRARADGTASAAAHDLLAAGDATAMFLRHVAQTSDAPRALDVRRASGARIFTNDGRSYVDLLAGIGVASIGHAHPDVARAVFRQAQRYTHVMVYGEDVLEPQVRLATRLAGLLPPSLQVTYFTNSGAEAIEGALKLVRKATRRERVLAFAGAFHGDTTGALALGGNPFYREPFRPLVAGIEHVPWDDDASLARIDASVAAVFAEPVQAEAGVRVPRADFLPRLAARCREVGALLVLDEVVTGFGRTGRWFAFEHWPGAAPDVLVLAKSLGGGLPLGAFVASRELMAVLSHDPPLGHVTTFGGNPVCCAAALASLDVLTRERLPERAAERGRELRERLG